MLFSVFENNRFEIRQMDQLTARIDSAKTITHNPAMNGHRQWQFSGLSGSKVQSKFRYRKKYQLDIAQAQVSQDPFWGTIGGLSLLLPMCWGTTSITSRFTTMPKAAGNSLKVSMGPLPRSRLKKEPIMLMDFSDFPDAISIIRKAISMKTGRGILYHQLSLLSVQPA